MAAKPLKVEIMVSREDGVVPYDSLTRKEKIDLGKRINQRAIQGLAEAKGWTVEFTEPAPESGTA